MAAVRLGHRPLVSGPDGRPLAHAVVLRLVGVVAVPGGDLDLDRKLGTLLACLDATLRRVVGVDLWVDRQ